MEKIENIFHYIKIGELLHTSGQPTKEEFNLLAQAGFKIVINIRPESEMKSVFNEKELVQSLGMQYIQIPMTFDTLDNKILDDFFSALEENGEKKVFAHCYKNIRITGLLGFYRIIKLGWEKDKAFREHSRFVEITNEFKNYIDEIVNGYLNR